MMKTGYRSFLLGLGLAALTQMPVYAQVGDLGNIMKGGVEDANYLLEMYMRPLGNGIGAGLNTGWTNNARTHKILGFDLRVGVAAIPIPAAERNYTIDPTRLTTLTLLNPQIGSSPTFAGNASDPTYRLAAIANIDPDGNGPIPSQPITLDQFEMPGGVWQNPEDMGLPAEAEPALATPSVQLSVGLIKKTDVMLRYVPKTDFGDYGKVGLMGVGLKHNLSQHLPLINRLKFLDISAVGGYTVFDYEVPLSLRDPANNQAVQGQMIDWQTTAWNANVVAGITIGIPIIKRLVEPHVYVGYGIENAETTLDMKGRYGFKAANPATGQVAYEYVNDPVSLNFKTPNNTRLIAGARVKVLSLVYVNAEYVESTYSSYSVGIGITIR